MKYNAPNKNILKKGDIYFPSNGLPAVITSVYDNGFSCRTFKNNAWEDYEYAEGIFLRENKGKLEIIAATCDFMNFLRSAQI